MPNARYLHKLDPELAKLARPQDDLRHQPAPGGQMRDSLFWQVSMADEKLCLQVYFFATDDGNAGCNVCLWGEGITPEVVDFYSDTVPDDSDFSSVSIAGLTLHQDIHAQRSTIAYEGARLKLDFNFSGLHEPFSYHANADGLPGWMAANRIEQSGILQGWLEIDGRRVSLDGRIGHRDHSWGLREWGMPQHWKWLAAYTPDGAITMNGWIWIAGGERGVAGYVARDGKVSPITAIRDHTEYDAEMIQNAATMSIDYGAEQPLELRFETFSAIRFPSSKRNPITITEAGCAATLDGIAGSGQFETHWPTPYLDYLRGRKQAPEG
ncbi:DUF7064 domain-containing protein [Paracoccus alkenifer]|uniref:DUF7064 domain-containing protein n=1 Tax=Paracoccus alkenifer TaxID=65735 RepID=A0A1H6NAJ1_9RHOB|nr:hypothetical protein [Paracoccus alkenifer]SEI11954.1 hypothetical protein SAMN04488075_3042 [Paracoccus alkenifer]